MSKHNSPINYGAASSTYPEMAPPGYHTQDPLLKKDQNQAHVQESAFLGQSTWGQAAEDDFSYGATVSQCSIEIRHAFMAKVYIILSVQLIGTVFFSALFSGVESIQLYIFRNQWVVIVSMIMTFVNLGLLFWKRHSYPLNFGLLATFTLFESVGLGTVVSYYSQSLVLKALFITLALFISLSAFALQSKYDFSSWQPYLGMGLWIIIILSFIQIFFPFSSGFDLIVSIGAAILFCGYILMDTHMIMNRLDPDEYILASVELYLDVVNLFLQILRILGNSDQD